MASERGVNYEGKQGEQRMNQIKEDCYWYDYWQDMNARIPFCKLQKVTEFLETCVDCERYHSKYKKINADRVRAMSDEEIESWYWWMHKEMMNYTDSHVFVHEWLKREIDK